MPMGRGRTTPVLTGQVDFTEVAEMFMKVGAGVVIVAVITILVLSLFRMYINRKPVDLVRLCRLLTTLDTDSIIQSPDHLAPLFTSNKDRLLCSLYPFRKLVVYVINWIHPGL